MQKFLRKVPFKNVHIYKWHLESPTQLVLMHCAAPLILFPTKGPAWAALAWGSTGYLCRKPGHCLGQGAVSQAPPTAAGIRISRALKEHSWLNSVWSASPWALVGGELRFPQVLGTLFHSIICQCQIFIEAHYVPGTLVSIYMVSPPQPWRINAIRMPTLEMRRLRCREREQDFPEVPQPDADP